MNVRDHHPFVRTLGRAINAGQSRSIVVTGNVEDLFFLPDESAVGGTYVPLVDCFAAAWRDVAGVMLLRYELNGPIRFERDADRERLRDAWVRWKTGAPVDPHHAPKGAQAKAADEFDEHVIAAIGRPTGALEFLRQLCLCSRSSESDAPLAGVQLVIIIEGADFILPNTEDITRLAVDDRRRVVIAKDWFSDPGFVNGKDTVLLIAESRGQLHSRVARLPQVIEVEVPAPSTTERELFATWFLARLPDAKRPRLWSTVEALAATTAGLTLHALRQLLVDASYDQRELTVADVTAKVEEFILSQLGEGTVEFLRPEHTLADVVGNAQLIAFIQRVLIPRFQRTDTYALPGAAVSGSIGAGKSYIFEAVAAEIGCPVLVLKNIRSKWLGETDVIFGRLRRVIDALAKVLIFVDEADTQFGSVSPDAHETERRLTGKIQAMMSDPKLRGKVHWLLMTARIHLLSPDIRRPGRVGNLILPVFDPTDDDREAFISWTLAEVVSDPSHPAIREEIDDLTRGYSAAAFAALREELRAEATKDDIAQVLAIARDVVPADIGRERRSQELQAAFNCTRRSLWPSWFTDETRGMLHDELDNLNQEGIR